MAIYIQRTYRFINLYSMVNMLGSIFGQTQLIMVMDMLRLSKFAKVVLGLNSNSFLNHLWDLYLSHSLMRDLLLHKAGPLHFLISNALSAIFDEMAYFLTVVKMKLIVME